MSPCCGSSWHEAGLREPTAAGGLRVGVILLARLDIANEFLRYAAEYDGKEWHSSDEQLEHDQTRRVDLADEGWVIGAMVAADVFGRARACEQIIRQARVEARGGRRLWIA